MRLRTVIVAEMWSEGMPEGVRATPISDSIGDGPLSAKNVTEAQLVAFRDTKSHSNSAERFFGCTNAGQNHLQGLSTYRYLLSLFV